MKRIILAVISLAIVLLVACVTQPTQPATSDTASVSLIARMTETTTALQTTANGPTEEVDIRELVEDFGKRLQAVSLLAPDAAQEIRDQYSEFVSAALLAEWANEVSKAPGRIVSSPWPDRIEIITLTRKEADKFVISGFVIEVTSVEIADGGAAAKKPVHIVVQRVQGHWLITDYAEER